MTDNDIIKALGICASGHLGCEDGCPYVTNSDSCSLKKDAIDLINRQKAEIERLTNKCESVFLCHDEEIGQAKKWARAEVITEFAERLKKYYNRLDNSQGNLISFHIDQIAKEMKGDQK